ncbi:MAG: Fe-S oxidoreductase [Proteobacteria bacterium]|nr:Fe-S oxidoreductase [Pseudomonadota bacterium]|tara:strand:+ start:309 stop:689 length:381 start_codon:yes stop_codon:yes gene_type:complete
MNDLNIQETERTPEIKLSVSDGVFSIRGESFPEDVSAFYGQVIESIDLLKENIPDRFQVIIELIYTNSSSIKALYRIFEGFESIRQGGGNLDILWYFQEDDDIMEELGEDFHDRFPDLKINVKPKN